jgi:outer membrane protein
MEFTVFQPEWDEAGLVKQALENREDLASARRGQSQQHLQTVEARAGFLPTLDLRLSHARSEQRSGYMSWEPYPANYGNSASLVFALPLFQGFSTTNAWQSSRIAERRQTLVQEQLKRQVQAEIRTALASLKSAWAQSRYTESNLELSKRSLALERERYKLGLSSLLQVQSAEATWRQAENENLSQRLTFRDRLAELELAVGAELTTP